MSDNTTPLIRGPTSTTYKQSTLTEEEQERLLNTYLDSDIDYASPLYRLDNEPPPSFPSIFVLPRPCTLVLIILFTIFTILILFVPPITKTIIEDWWHTTTCHVVEVGSLPIISIVFSYIHIYAALWLTFYPTVFVGILRIPGTNVGLPGWEGIVPFKRIFMAKIAVDLMTKRLLDIEEVFRQVDPEKVKTALKVPLAESCAPLIHQLGDRYAPNVWHSLAPQLQHGIIHKLSENTPNVVGNFLLELQQPGLLTRCLDVEHLVTAKLMADRNLLNEIFIRCGHAELAFIRDAGAWMGGFFGILQAILYLFYDAKWVLPTAGLILGCFTNWISLTAIFRPVDPWYIPILWPKCWSFGCCRRPFPRHKAVSSHIVKHNKRVLRELQKQRDIDDNTTTTTTTSSMNNNNNNNDINTSSSLPPSSSSSSSSSASSSTVSTTTPPQRLYNPSSPDADLMYNDVCYDQVYRASFGYRWGLAEIPIHGLFLARQRQVSHEYGIVASQSLINARSVITEMFTGPHKDVLFQRSYKHITSHVDTMLNELSVAGITPRNILDDNMIRSITQDIISFTLHELPFWLCRSDILRLLDESLNAQDIMYDKLCGLESEEFEGLLHPVFKQDEWKLILMGGLLGVAIGTMQTFLINTGCS